MIDVGFKLVPYTGPVAYRKADRVYRGWLLVPDDAPDEKRVASTSEVMLWAILQHLREERKP